MIPQVTDPLVIMPVPPGFEADPWENQKSQLGNQKSQHGKIPTVKNKSTNWEN
jgi:hypothetical protein